MGAPVERHNRGGDSSAPTRRAAPVRRLLVLLCTLSIFATLVAVPSAGAADASPSDELNFVEHINKTRAGSGLPPLELDKELTVLARGWTEQMRDGVCGAGNHICHASPISAGVTHQWAKLGENVGTGGDVPSVMQAFIDSPGHYANIVDPAFTHVGVGVVWRDGRMYTTHRFMSLQTDTPTTTTAAPQTTTTAAPQTTTTAAPQTTTTTVAPADPAPTTTTTVAAPAEDPATTPDDEAEELAREVVRAQRIERTDRMIGVLASLV